MVKLKQERSETEPPATKPTTLLLT